MRLTRRQFVIAGGLFVVSCRRRVPLSETHRPGKLDVLLAAHADALPENGGGANHYPMAAEALVALGHEDAIQDSWIEGASLYAGEVPRVGPIEDLADALGSYERFGDWLAVFRHALEREAWRSVVARWIPRLAAGVSAAAFHGVLRTGHAVRALHQRESDARKGELAVGLAYWASRSKALPTIDGRGRDQKSLRERLEGLSHPWLEEDRDVGFHEVGDRLSQPTMPVAPPLVLDSAITPEEELHSLVRDAAAGVLEMLVLKRNRLWLMHTVTGPAAVGLILPVLGASEARTLVAYTKQAVVAMFAAYGAPYTSRAHERPSPEAWPQLIERAVASGSVHTIKLAEALRRFDVDGDLLCRSVLTEWLDWK